MANIKNRIFFLLSLIFLLANVVYGQKIDYKGFHQRYNYYGSPFYYNLGYKVIKNDFVIYPTVGLRFDVLSDGDLLVDAGVTFRYKNFFSSFMIVRQLLPSFFIADFSTHSFQTLDTYGEFVLGYDLFFATVSSISKVGLMRETTEMKGDKPSRALELAIIEQVKFQTSVLDDGLHKIAFTLDMTFNILPNVKQYWYDINLNIPFSFLWANGVLETLFLAGFNYSDYLLKSQTKYLIDQKPFVNKIRLGGRNTLYQFSGFLEMEQRVYFRGLRADVARLYLSFFSNIGYGVKRDHIFNRGSLFYMYGAGIGYNIADEYPLQIQLGADNYNNFLFNISFASPIIFPK